MREEQNDIEEQHRIRLAKLQDRARSGQSKEKDEQLVRKEEQNDWDTICH